MAINSVTVSGNLVKDLELRATANGYPVGNGTVAVNERRKQQDGSYVDEPNYIDFVILGERANKLAQYLSKGTKVTISGKLHQRRWTDKETGKTRSAVEVTVNDLDFMSRRQDQPQGYQQAPQAAPQQAYQQPQRPAYQPAPQAYQPAPQQAPQANLYDSDIPF